MTFVSATSIKKNDNNKKNDEINDKNDEQLLRWLHPLERQLATMLLHDHSHHHDHFSCQFESESEINEANIAPSIIKKDQKIMISRDSIEKSISTWMMMMTDGAQQQQQHAMEKSALLTITEQITRTIPSVNWAIDVIMNHLTKRDQNDETITQALWTLLTAVVWISGNKQQPKATTSSSSSSSSQQRMHAATIAVARQHRTLLFACEQQQHGRKAPLQHIALHVARSGCPHALQQPVMEAMLAYTAQTVIAADDNTLDTMCVQRFWTEAVHAFGVNVMQKSGASVGELFLIVMQSNVTMLHSIGLKWLAVCYKMGHLTAEQLLSLNGFLMNHDRSIQQACVDLFKLMLNSAHTDKQGLVPLKRSGAMMHAHAKRQRISLNPDSAPFEISSEALSNNEFVSHSSIFGSIWNSLCAFLGNTIPEVASEADLLIALALLQIAPALVTESHVECNRLFSHVLHLLQRLLASKSCELINTEHIHSFVVTVLKIPALHAMQAIAANSSSFLAIMQQILSCSYSLSVDCRAILDIACEAKILTGDDVLKVCSILLQRTDSSLLTDKILVLARSCPSKIHELLMIVCSELQSSITDDVKLVAAAKIIVAMLCNCAAELAGLSLVATQSKDFDRAFICDTNTEYVVQCPACTNGVDMPPIDCESLGLVQFLDTIQQRTVSVRRAFVPVLFVVLRHCSKQQLNLFTDRMPSLSSTARSISLCSSQPFKLTLTSAQTNSTQATTSSMGIPPLPGATYLIIWLLMDDDDSIVNYEATQQLKRIYRRRGCATEPFVYIFTGGQTSADEDVDVTALCQFFYIIHEKCSEEVPDNCAKQRLISGTRACGAALETLSPSSEIFREVLKLCSTSVLEPATPEIHLAVFETVRSAAAKHGLLASELFKRQRADFWIEILRTGAKHEIMLEDLVEQFFAPQPLASFIASTLYDLMPALLIDDFSLNIQLCLRLNDIACLVFQSVVAPIVPRFIATILINLTNSWPNCHKILQMLTCAGSCEGYDPPDLDRDVGLSQLICNHQASVVIELISQLGDMEPSGHASIVTALEAACYPKALRHSANNLAYCPSIRLEKGMSLSAALSKYFLRFHSSLEKYNNPDMQQQSRHLRALYHLIPLIGPHRLYSFVTKLTGILKIYIKMNAYRDRALECWQQLASTLHPPVLGPIMNQLLIPLLSCTSHRIVYDIYKEILIHKQEYTKSSFSYLPFVVNEFDEPFKSLIAQVIHPPASRSLADKLKQLTNVFDSKLSDVHAEALHQLRLVLLQDRDKFQVAYIEGEQREIVSKLIRHLLKLCKDFEPSIRLAASLSLGDLGAIDPAIITLKSASEALTFSDYMIDANGKYNIDKLCISLIKGFLVPALRASSAQDQNRAMYAIQELLKLMGCDSDTPRLEHQLQSMQRQLQRQLQHQGIEQETFIHPLAQFTRSDRERKERGLRNWRLLHSDLHDVLIPCLDSEYAYAHLKMPERLSADANKNDELRSSVDDLPMSQYTHVPGVDPLFTNIMPPPITSLRKAPKVHFAPNVTFQTWLFEWCRDLTVKSVGPRKPVFLACQGVVKNDLPTAMFLLKELVDEVLQYGDKSDVAQVGDELSAVLSYAASMCDGLETPQGSHTQAVFELLDQLFSWYEIGKYRKLPFTPVVTGDHSNLPSGRNWSERLECLQNQVSYDLLARAAYGHRSHTRSLRYLELHIRQRRKLLKPQAPLHSAAATLSQQRTPSSANALRRTSSSINSVENVAARHVESVSLDIIKSGPGAGLSTYDIDFLQRVYAQIDEPDGLCAIRALREESSLSEQIRELESAGKWAESLTAYEQALHSEPYNSQYQIGLLESLRHLGHFITAISHASAHPSLAIEGVKSAWRISDWSTAARFVVGCAEPTFDVFMARLLIALHEQNWPVYDEAMQHAQMHTLTKLQNASWESYQKSYPYCVHLHILQEFEQIRALRLPICQPALITLTPLVQARSQPKDPALHNLLRNWKHRLVSASPILSTQELILAARRCLFSEFGLGAEAGQCWLNIAQLSLSARQYEAAEAALAKAAALDVFVSTERAKLMHDRGNVLEALLFLEKECNRSAQVPETVQAEQYLLLGNWAEETGSRRPADVISRYHSANHCRPSWDRGHFHMASYLDKLLESESKLAKDKAAQLFDNAKKASLNSIDPSIVLRLKDVITHYGLALEYGHTYLFQALPRLLTLLFSHCELWQRLLKSTTKDIPPCKDDVCKLYQSIIKLANKLVDSLPSYQWVTALPQIISRLLHPHEEVHQLIQRVLLSMLEHYPNHVMWHLASSLKSAEKTRRMRVENIIQRFRECAKENKGQILVIDTSLTVQDQLWKLCNEDLSHKSNPVELKARFPLLTKVPPRVIVVPTQFNMNVALPAADPVNSAVHRQHKAFADDIPKLLAFEEEIEVLKTKERPRKITMLASDGNSYVFLAKKEIKGDMRKNSRMMEVASVINRLFKTNSDSRQRELSLHTFFVTILSDDSGLIEWVRDTIGYRNLIYECFKEAGVEHNIQKIRNIYDQANKEGKKAQDIVQMFNTVQSMSPPHFHLWFLRIFRDPAAWFFARLLFARSCAVWSIVGWLVGLGDRHGENILIHTRSGECIHVDFDCLFGKGVLLDRPERVPFRLTPNMTDAMGIAGLSNDGPFRRGCEVALSVLRQQQSTAALLAVLQAFLYDPLVEWRNSQSSLNGSQRSSIVRRGQSESSFESNGWHTKAIEILSQIESKLVGHTGHIYEALLNLSQSKQGILQQHDTHALPMSVEGQVDQLVREATDPLNLGQMYIGWMSWL